MKIGDIVKCNKATGSTFLRSWKKYELVGQNGHGNWQVKDLETGNLSAHWYKPDRFVVEASASLNKIDLSKKYFTRNGSKVKLYAITDDPKYPVVGTLADENGSISTESWTINGDFHTDQTFSDYDLVEAPQAIELKLSMDTAVWVYADSSVYIKLQNKDVAWNIQDVEKLYEAVNKMKQR